MKSSQTQTGKSRKFLNAAFAAMIVLTAAMVIATVVNSSRRKHSFGIPDDIELVQEATIAGNIADDAPVTVISTNLGDFAAELYPQFAPETVANYTSLVESGYYSGTYIYTVEKGLYFGGGCKFTDGSLPDDYDKSTETVGPELSKSLWPLRGAMMSCGLTHATLFNGQETYSGSRFLVSGTIDFTDEIKQQLSSTGGAGRVADLFLKYGGTPNVSQQITVFAQVFDGMDVIDAVLSVETDEENSRPYREIVINGAEICTYADYLKKAS